MTSPDNNSESNNPDQNKADKNENIDPSLATPNDDPDKISEHPDDDLPENEDAWSELGKTVLLALFLALIVRTLFFEPFNIPSGSMKPTLLIGDYLFVSKTAYGYSKYSFPMAMAPIEGRVWKSLPEQGDIVVFKLPSKPSIDYIKRVVGLPGDKIQVINGRLYINDRKVPREARGYETVTDRFGRTASMIKYLETLPNGVQHYIYEEGDDRPLDNTPKYTVPEDHVFVMGDNRDNSQDSRVPDLVGFVPVDKLVGRADMLFFSANGKASIWEVWKWPWSIRYERIFKFITPKKAPGQEA